VPRVHEPEAFRQHADDLARRAVDHDPAPHRARITAETALPVAMAEHHDIGAARPIVLLGERPAVDRPDAEQREQPESGIQAVNPLRLAKAGHGIPVALPDGDVLQCLRLFPVGDVVRKRGIEVGDVDAGRGLPQTHEPVRLGVGQRLQEDTVDDGEDRGVGADPQGQREQCGQREYGSAGQAAAGMPHVAQQIEHRDPS
jgi:hypothetical protein